MQPTSQGRTIAWSLIAFMTLANIVGYTSDLYERFWWYDRFLHSMTGFAGTLGLALFVFGPVVRLRHSVSHRVLLVLVVASVGLGIGALWEVVEWGYDFYAEGDAIKGKYDTIMDLIMDGTGAVLAGVACLSLARSSDDA